MALTYQWVCEEILYASFFSIYSLIYSFRFWYGVIEKSYVQLARMACYSLKSTKDLNS